MLFKKVTLACGVFTLAVASAASSSYEINIPTATSVGDKQLKAGTYQVTIQDDKAIFKSGKQSVEIAAKTEKAAKKYKNNELDTADSKLREIHVGGTDTKIVFAPTGTPSTAAGN